jgi:flagellar biosynthetic protein FlhB
MIYMNLQLFAGEEKTEKPTSKRRSEAREEGQVVQSREVSTTLILVVTFITIKLMGSYFMSHFKALMVSPFRYFDNADSIFRINNIYIYMQNVFINILLLVAPIFIACIITALVSGYIQVGFLFTTKPLTPKFERLNPLQGIKRMFSARSVLELLKSIAKLLVLGYIAYSYIASRASSITILYDMSIEELFMYIADVVFNVVMRMSFALIIIAGIDYFFQWRQNEKGLKMSKEEIKQEFKQSEGNPEIKSKIKQKQRQMAMQRMMQDVPKADVVITNPTHYAVALKYDQEKFAAPMVIAKGQDYVAQRIKLIAKENKVEIVENKPLARSLFSSTEVGEAIPQELYQAVAEVIAYVYTLKAGRR